MSRRVHKLVRAVSICASMAILSPAVSAADTPGASGPLSPSATACLQGGPCSTAATASALAELAQNWNSGTDAERGFFATTAPTLFSFQQITAMFSGFDASGSTSMPAFNESSSSCYSDPGVPIPCDVQSGDATQTTTAPTPTSVVPNITAKCTIHDTWDSNQFIGGSNNGKYDVSGATDFSCFPFIEDTCMETVGAPGLTAGFDANKPLDANISTGFGTCDTNATAAPFNKYQTPTQRTKLRARSNHLLTITLADVVWGGSKQFCNPVGTPVTVCTFTHNFKTGGGGQATYTPAVK